jgi:hypothetical protein
VAPAWPRRGRAPRTALARWLARQVGPARHPRVRVATAAAAELGAPTGRIVSAVATGGNGLLALVRSYEIPTDDPSYERLLNLSWTYDSAISAAAFVESNNRGQAKQLLDQLSALQNSDGSIDFAFNVATGAGIPLLRSGTIAWVGLAAAAFDKTFKTNAYLKTEELAANYLLSLQGANGLIKGGPDVQWVSTQHNLIAYAFLAHLGSELVGDGEASTAARYQAAATRISSAVATYLLVQDGTEAWFREGLEDNVQSLDAQALGAMYLQGLGQSVLGKLVLAHAQSSFALSGQSISLSAAPATYNMSYSAPGPFSGYEPYLGSGAPDVLWFEGTAEMRMATAAYGQSTTALDQSMAQWQAVTKKSNDAPLQANQTLTSLAYGVEYHVWPAAAPAAWVILAQSTSSLLAAPLLGGTTLATPAARCGAATTSAPCQKAASA